MRYSTQIKPISYVKAHAAELLDQITADRQPIIITQNGEARAVLMDIYSYEDSQETMTLLNALALSEREIEAGRNYPISEVLKEFRPRRTKADEAASDPANGPHENTR